MESEDTPLLGWMVANLGLSIEKAELVNKKLTDSWITSVESLQTVLSENPSVFDEIEIPKPIQAVFKTKLSSFSSKKVEELVESDVMHLIGYLFPGEDYASVFLSKKINGFVLSSATEPAKLVEWGIAFLIHAEALWARLAGWKQSGGVQFKLLREAATAMETRKKSSEFVGAEKSMTGQKRDLSEISDTRSSESAPSKRSGRASDQGSVLEDTADKPCSSASSTSSKSSSRSGSSVGSSGEGTKKKASRHTKINRELANLLHQTNPEPKRRRHDTVPPPPPPSSRTSDSGQRSSTPSVSRPAPGASASEGAGSSSKTTKSPRASCEKMKKKARREYEASSEEEEEVVGQSLNGKIKANLAKLNTNNKDQQAEALRILSKQAADHPDTVGMLRNVGVVDKMLEIIAHARNYDEYVVWRAMIALNNIIARAKSLHVRYLIEKGILLLILPFVHSLSTRLRLQALWIIGNLGTFDGQEGFKSAVLATDAVATMVQSYSSVNQLTGYTGPDNVRDRYAQTINQLANNRTAQQFRVLKAFVPILRDIIRVESNVEAVQNACFAIDHLLDATEVQSVDCLIDEDLIPVLVHRLDDPKISVAHGVLVTLTVFAECCTSSQVLEMEPVLRHLERFIVGSLNYRPNKKLTAQAVVCVARVCEGGDQSIQQIMDHALDLFHTLVDMVQTASSGLSAVRATSEGAALALSLAVQGANVVQLEYFVSLKMYPFLFQLLDIFSEELLIVEETIKALTSMVLKVGNVRHVQERAASKEDFDVSEGWGFLYGWARAPSSKDVISAEERKDRLEIAEFAKHLLVTAQDLDLVPNEFLNKF